MPNISSYKIKGLNLGFNTLTALRNIAILAFFKRCSLGLISLISAYNIIKLVAIIVIINSGSFRSI
jgi:hypothetical protein